MDRTAARWVVSTEISTGHALRFVSAPLVPGTQYGNSELMIGPR